MKRDHEIPQEVRTKFLRSIKKEEDIDDFTFKIWKSELQKELSFFWESMSKL